MRDSVIDEITLKSLIVVTGWIGLPASTAYAFYKYPDELKQNLQFVNGYSEAKRSEDALHLCYSS